MLKRFKDFVEGLPPRTMLAINLTYTVLAIASNLVIAYAIWHTIALYPVSSGWAAFGLVWALLTGAASIITNIVNLVVRVPSSLTQYRDERALAIRAAKYRSARSGRSRPHSCCKPQ